MGLAGGLQIAPVLGEPCKYEITGRVEGAEEPAHSFYFHPPPNSPLPIFVFWRRETLVRSPGSTCWLPPFSPAAGSTGSLAREGKRSTLRQGLYVRRGWTSPSEDRQAGLKDLIPSLEGNQLVPRQPLSYLPPLTSDAVSVCELQPSFFTNKTSDFPSFAPSGFESTAPGAVKLSFFSCAIKCVPSPVKNGAPTQRRSH